MASNYIITQVDPAGGGAVTRTENIVTRVEHIDTQSYSNEWRYHWNCDTLVAVPAPGYVFDHWTISIKQKWYDGIDDPNGKSPFLWEDGPYYKGMFFDNPLVLGIKDGELYPDILGSDAPGYSDVDTYVGSEYQPPIYYRPWIENYATITAYFKKVTPTYTHLPVYEIRSSTLMYHIGANKLLRDSP